MTNILPSVKEIANNDDNVFLQASEILLKFADNIIKNPENDKYRKIRVGNPIISEKLLPVSGAIECLFEMGFIEDGDYFTLPRNTSLRTLRLVKEQLNDLMTRRKSPTAQASSSSLVSSANVSAALSAMAQPVQQFTRPPSTQIIASEAGFYNKLISSLSHVLLYEDRVLQEKARSSIPQDRLEKLSRERHAEYQQSSGSDDGVSLRDLMLLELLTWFKKEFFRWVDAPACEQCGGKTQHVGMVEASSEDRRYGAGRVENYKCTICQSFTRFPRYNHPGKLLETRRGRCGEWANCFTLCCRALGYDARYTLDWTDHVWTEVYSEAQKRWLHCDACENVCDKPLLYEAGWGKKLSYVISFSRDDIQDVSWRYSSQHALLLTRRNECRESWLVNTIVKLRTERQKGLSAARKLILDDRLIREMAELMTIRSDVKDGESGGRVSGSLTWRTARSETGNKPVKSVSIKPTATERAAKYIHLEYNTARDLYVRKSSDDQQTNGWQSLLAESQNIQRKEEHDWGMVYLARQNDTQTASIAWNIDLAGSGLVVEDVRIRADSACYENGSVVWTVCSGDICARIQPEKEYVSSEFAGSDHVRVEAQLRGGKGENAWQHTQLFRQKVTDITHAGLSILVTLRSDGTDNK